MTEEKDRLTVGEAQAQTQNERDAEPGDASNEKMPFVAMNLASGNSLTSVTAKAIVRQTEREASRLKIPVKTLGFCLLALAVALALFRIIPTSSSKSNVLRQDLVTVQNANRFTIDSLGRAREKLASRTDTTLYEFLAEHKATEAFHIGNKDNVVREVLLAIEHESAQTGVVLLVQLFSDIYAAWPKTYISEQGKKTMKKLILQLQNIKDDPNLTPEENAVSRQTEIARIRGEIMKLKSFGEVKGDSKDPFAGNDAKAIASTLRSAIDVDEARSYLAKIDKIRIGEFKGKPMAPKDLSGKTHDNNATAAPTIHFVPTELSLVDATKAIESLEAFVNNKVELNAILRSMLLVDLRNP